MTTEKDRQARAAVFLQEQRAQADARLNGEQGLAAWNFSGVAHKPARNLPTTGADDGTGKKA